MQGTHACQRKCLDWEEFRELPEDDDLGNLVAIIRLQHTAFTYHRTWETGLGSEIRVTDFSPDFIFRTTPIQSLLHA
jgi:hypothetical protein